MTLSDAILRFRSLHRNTHAARGAAPHKPVLLLAILSEMDAGRVAENLVRITPELVASFHTHWQALVPAGSGWRPRMATPFCHLRYDGFWSLTKDGDPATVPERPEPGLNQLAALCDGGRFADDLWTLLAAPTARAALRQTLLDAYFPGQQASAPVVADYLVAQAEALQRQAQARFVARVREARDDGYFVRHRLFPKVIRDLYDFRCCVCDLGARLDGRSPIQAAHILPFADFHNDDPRNGLALCANHHWGFDNGAWSVDDECRVIVSPRLEHADGFLTNGRPLAGPRDPGCAPAADALAWHRQHTFCHGPERCQTTERLACSVVADTGAETFTLWL